MIRSRGWFWTGVGMIVAGVAWEIALAEDEPAASGGEAIPARLEFDRRFTEYKDALRAIEGLRIEYQTADAATRDEVNRQLREQMVVARQRLDAMVAAAVDVYRQAPNADPQVTELLLSVARYYAVGQTVPRANDIVRGGDSYEQSLPILQSLIDGGAAEKQLPVWGLLAAMATNDYDLAESYLARAQEAGVLADPQSLEDLAEQGVMDKALQLAGDIGKCRDLWAKEQAIRAAEAEADDLPRVRLSTTHGEIVLELFENEAPQTVANFITLVKSGYYDGVAFHRVIHCFMAQGGDPRGDGQGGPGYTIRCECHQPDYRHHFRGSLSMAHRGRDTGGSQFFLTFVPTPHLDGRHTVFGRVMEGFDVLGELQKRQPTGRPQEDAALPSPDRILQAEVLRDRGHEYKFEKLPGG